MILRNYKLVFKAAAFGFVVLYTPDYSEERLRAMPPKTRLSFVVRNKNPRFMNFTQIPFWPEGVTFHYSNLYGGSEDLKMDYPPDVYYYFKGLKVGDVKKKLLHLPEHVLLTKRASKFNIALDNGGRQENGVSYDSIVVKDEFGEEASRDGVPFKKKFRDAQKDLLKRYVDHHSRGLSKEGLSPAEKDKRFIEIFNQQEKELSAMPMSDHSIDLRHAPSGKYTIGLGNHGTSTIYVTENPEMQSFGMLDIHLDTPTDALLNRDAKTPEEVINSQLFQFHFEARSTYWRYIFVNYEGSKITPKLVRDENSLIEFTDPVESRLEQMGTPMQFCQSETPVQLQDRPTQMLFLARMNGKRNMKEIRLPTPAADRVKPERQPGGEGEKVFSEVYVYL